MSEEQLGQKFMEVMKGIGGAVAEGVGKAIDMVQSSPTLNDMANHGRTELAAAIFNGDPYVMYQKGSHDQKPSPEVQEPQIQESQSRGRTM